MGGVNVAPLEVEQVLRQHPDIVRAFVVGIPEIVAPAVELRGRAANGSAGSPRLARTPRGSAWRPRELCRRAKSKPRRYLVAYQPLTAEGDDCRRIPSG